MLARIPTIVELQSFLAVAHCGSFRQAAEQLFVTQAAVSRAVLRLEEDLGADLFTRSGAGVRMTPAGEELRRLVDKPVAALEKAAVQFRRRTERLRLRIAVVTSLGHLWLMPRLEDFRARHPQIEVEFRQYERDEDFLREDVDLWIALKRKPQQRWPRQVAAQYLIGKEIVAVCTPKVATGIRTAAQLLAKPLLYLTSFPDNSALWAQAVGARLPAHWRGTGFDLVINLVEAARAGMGVAVVQQCMVEQDLASGRLVMPVAGVGSTGRGYYLLHRRALGAHAAAEAFSDWVKQQARKS